MDATMPGRWAAPPAPAMMTLWPASRAPRAKLTSRSGVRCAETMRLSWAMPCRTRSGGTGFTSGDDIRQQTVVQRRDAILEGEFALFHPLDANVVGAGGLGQRDDCGVEIA